MEEAGLEQKAADVPACEPERAFVETEKQKIVVAASPMESIWQSLNMQPSARSQPERKPVASPKPKSGEARSEASKSQLPEQSQARIKRLLEQYRQTLSSSRLEPIERQRNQVKERLIRCLLVGVEELRALSDLSEAEAQLVASSEKAQLEAVRQHALAIEGALMANLNRGLRESLSKTYNDRFRIIFANLKDQNNAQLRRKVLARQVSPRDLCLVNEIELYNPARRAEIEEKEKLLMRQNTISQNSVVRIKDGVILDDEEEVSKEGAASTPQQTPVRKPEEKKNQAEVVKKELEGMMGRNAFAKFQSRILEDLAQKQAQPLLAHLRKLYQQ